MVRTCITKIPIAGAYAQNDKQLCCQRCRCSKAHATIIRIATNGEWLWTTQDVSNWNQRSMYCWRWEGCIHFPFDSFRITWQIRGILTSWVEIYKHSYFCTNKYARCFRAGTKVCLMTKRFVPCYGLFYKGLVQRTWISWVFGNLKKAQEEEGKKKGVNVKNNPFPFLEWSLFEILSGIEEMLSIILTKVWPKFGHAYWKGQDGQRKTSRRISPDTSFSSIFRSADLKGPQSLKGATGLLPSATQHCWGNLLKNSCLRSSVLRSSPSSSLLDFQRALGINVTSGIVMSVVARSYVIESCAIFCEPKLIIQSFLSCIRREKQAIVVFQSHNA